jgi:transcriptional regulator with XRE-family HTH domain
MGNETPLDDNNARTEIRTAVQLEMDARSWGFAHLANAANVSPQTVSRFIRGQRWPNARTQRRIEHALEWRPGSIRDAEVYPEILPTYESAVA